MLKNDDVANNKSMETRTILKSAKLDINNSQSASKWSDSHARQHGATCPYGKDPTPTKFPTSNQNSPTSEGKPKQVRSLAEIMGRN